METTAGQTSYNPNNTAAGRETHPHKRGKQSFASLFKDNRAPVEASLLQFIAPPTGEVVIGIDEIDSVEKSFGYCLVGYVMGQRPSPFTVLNFVKRWDGNVKFQFKDFGWIQFQFATEVDRDSVLNGGPYMISGRQLFLKKMPSCFLFSKEDMMFLPSWVQIFGLPADCWTAPALSKIASVVGKPIHTDQLTISKKGSTYARVLVEIDASKSRVWEYAVKLPTGKTTIVKFTYELEPKFCNNCSSLGHESELCRGHARHNNHTQSMNQKPTDINSSKAAGNNTNAPTVTVQLPAANNLEEPSKPPLDEPQCSKTMDMTIPESAVLEQLDMATYDAHRNSGKAIDITLPMDGETPHHDYGDDDLFSDADTDRPTPNIDDCNLGSTDLDDILSPVQTQDKDEWKIVSKKYRRLKNKMTCETADNGSSSMETEYVALDPISKQKMKGKQPRLFKKNFK